MTTATASWPNPEADPQRKAILAAADRLLAGTPHYSSGNLSVVQLAIEAQVKYWVVAQRHTDLRDHFQALVQSVGRTHGKARNASAEEDRLIGERDQLRRHCSGLEELIRTYAVIINELSHENDALRGQLSERSATITPLQPRTGRSKA